MMSNSAEGATNVHEVTGLRSTMVVYYKTLYVVSQH